MRNPKVPLFFSTLFEPTRVFIALLIAVIIWLYPAITQPVLSNTEKIRKPLQEYGGVSLVSAVEAHANCARSCQNEVCVDWVSGPSPECPRPGRGGGCCMAYEIECDPGCSDPTPITLPPTIAATLNCSQNGSNGWCIGSLSLNLSAADPQGQSIIISGVLNGTPFACPNGSTTCSIPVSSEGTGTISYRVDSATGLAANGSTTYQLDLSTPQLDGDLSGASGTNGWFTSDVIFSASAADSISGLAALETSTDNGSWTSYTAPITLSDGVHTVALRSYDNAGNLVETNQTISIDTITPVLDSSVSGVAGLNGWYVSNLQVSATASDSGSGLFTLEVSADGGAWTSYTAPITLSDGVHTVQFRATDNAGNATESTQTIKVDTVTPTLNLSINGKTGLNGWYTSITQISATSGDSGSGVAIIEGEADSAAWVTVNSLSFSDGLHTYQFKATDVAGNTTIVPVQNLKVDTIAPGIDMTEAISLGDTVYYYLEDNGSGLSIYRAVIEDDDEKYKKVVWLDSISGNKLEDQILWDGKFADGTKAAWGEYFITLKISDAAGNETMKTTVVSVNLLSALQIIPPFTPPQVSRTIEPSPTAQTESVPSTDFGGTSNEATGEITSSSFASAGGIRNEGGAMTMHSWTQASNSTTPDVPQSTILWGAAATALVGATLADWKRKRDEEEQRAREERQASGPSTYRKIAMAYQASLNNFRAALSKAQGMGMSETEVDRLKADVVNSGKIGASLGAAKDYIVRKEREADTQADWIEKQEAANAAILQETLAAQEAAEEAQSLQSGLAAYYAGRKAGETAVAPTKDKKSWWEKAWDWTYKHQTELSLGTGVVVGAAAVAAILLVSAPVWLTVGGAVLATGALVTAGTVALNAHFGLDLGHSLGENLVVGIAATIVTAGVGLLIANVAPLVGTAITKICTDYVTACTQVGTIIDKGEEALLAGQIAYYNWVGDQDKVVEATIQLQLEQMDGDAPGNTVAEEVGEQINQLGPKALEIVEEYGDDAIPFLLKYGDDAVDIIGSYGDEGIALLSRFGDDTWNAIGLVRQYGTPAVKLLNTVDPASADRLLRTLDPDVLDYALKQDSDAVFALSRWSEKELKEFGPELALRAEKDAKVLKAIKSLTDLGPIDPKNLTTEQKYLINIIAENSMQYADEGQIVLGKWVDYGNGFTSYARETGSVHYNPHPDMWNLLGKLGEGNRDETAWLVNKQVIQAGIDKGLPFEYTLQGIPTKDILKEQNAVQLIFSGATDSEIKQALKLDYVPVRIKELQELKRAGYKFVFDEMNGSFILSLP